MVVVEHTEFRETDCVTMGFNMFIIVGIDLCMIYFRLTPSHEKLSVCRYLLYVLSIFRSAVRVIYTISTLTLIFSWVDVYVLLLHT
jgi:hypothetical protein